MLLLLLDGQATMLLSPALAFEYEATCMRPEHLAAAKVGAADVATLIDAIFAVIEPAVIYYQWRSQLPDPDDDMLLETAVNGRADAIVTFNRKDYGTVPARFGIAVLSPAEALRRLRK